MDFATSLDHAFKARLPLLYLETSEEVRVIDALRQAVKGLRTPRPVWVWTSALGLVDPEKGSVEGTSSPIRALDHALAESDGGVYVFCDLHLYFGTDTRPGDPAIIRKVRETALEFRHGDLSRMLVVTSPVRVIPPELDKMTTLIGFPLPNSDDLRGLLDAMIGTNSSGSRAIKVKADEAGLEQLVQAALGLTMHEAENAFARAMVNDGVLGADDVSVVLDEKRQAVSKSGLLDFVDAGLDLDQVGGLGNLKSWLSRRQGSWLAKARAFGLPSPKGVLITGVPGCGKSLTAKATAASWGLPLLRLDIGRIFSGLVGSSEQNLRTAIATAEAVSPCILWVDEIEKGFSGTSGNNDSGTSARVFGYFLTWMQEKSKPVFVVATANNIDQLPPEFMRKGRFDEVFFVDLPTDAERHQIWSIQMRSHAVPANGLALIADDPAAVDALSNVSENYSGAEIEQAVIAALYEAFSESRPVTLDDVSNAIETMIPLAITQSEQVARIREWAATRAVRATASTDIAAAERGTEPEPEAVAVSSHRGGRTVEF